MDKIIFECLSEGLKIASTTMAKEGNRPLDVDYVIHCGEEAVKNVILAIANIDPAWFLVNKESMRALLCAKYPEKAPKVLIEKTERFTEEEICYTFDINPRSFRLARKLADSGRTDLEEMVKQNCLSFEAAVSLL